jgi:hypothetical protein
MTSAALTHLLQVLNLTVLFLYSCSGVTLRVCATAVSRKAGTLRAYATAVSNRVINPLYAELNPMCHLLALLVDHHILHVSRIRVKLCVWTRTVSSRAIFCPLEGG